MTNPAGQHLRVVGGLHIGLAVFGVLGALAVIAAMSVALTAIEEETDGSEERIAMQAVTTAMVVAVAFIAIGVIISLVAGIGVLQAAPWGRTMAYIASGLQLLNVPFGTAVGIYGFVALGMEGAQEYFEKPWEPVPTGKA